MSKAKDSNSLERRYHDSVKAIQSWLEENGRSQSWLAKQLGVERSLLSRYLDPSEQQYKPEPGRQRMMEILMGIERICSGEKRDLFISHRSTDKDFVRRLASDIEAQRFGDRYLTTWMDEAEIRVGESIPAKINEALECSRFVALVMTPQYFKSDSGWTDAEWHAALHKDPDNKRARLLPIIAADCPYMPALLRHLLAVDCRGTKYDGGLQQILGVLRDEPLPRPVAYRGQLITPTGLISRSTLIAERSVPDADPDVISEKAYCNLLPVERLPKYVYVAPIATHLKTPKADGTLGLPNKSAMKEASRLAQIEAGIREPFVPAFRLHQDALVTFHDLESAECPLYGLIDSDRVEVWETEKYSATSVPTLHIVISLLNMAISRHMHRRGFEVDRSKFNPRFFFSPNKGKERIVEWIPRKVRAKRTVAKPYITSGSERRWIHQACYIKTIYLASHFYIQILPTRLLTSNGHDVLGGPKVGRIVTRWLGQERNLHVLYNVRFWTLMLRSGPGPISVRAGDQWLEVATVPAFIQQAYGIAGDQKDLLGLLDQEAASLAQQEDRELESFGEAQEQDENSSDDLGKADHEIEKVIDEK